MKTLLHYELNQVQGGAFMGAIVAGSVSTLLGWAGIVYYKDVTYQLHKPENIGLISGLGAVVGGIAYMAGILL